MVAGRGTQPLSSFTESIVLLTIHGRCLSHQLQCNVEKVLDTTPQESLTRHQWLDGILSHHTQLMSSRHLPVDSELCDPMSLFTEMAGQAAVLSLALTLESVKPGVQTLQELIGDYREKAVLAAQKISTLAQELCQLGCFKVKLQLSYHSFFPLTSFTRCTRSHR